jgi:hypothetical protein
MRVLLLQLDGKLPNIALMRIAAHHRGLGDDVELRRISNPRSIERGLWDEFGKVYASAIFEWSRPLAARLLEVYPEAIVGGTGWDLTRTLESIGITTKEQDYSAYPDYPHSIGFTQRGCRLKCSFCVVPKIEGSVRSESAISDIWRGGDHARNLCLLDNDFGGAPGWRNNIADIREGGFRVSFNQGLNARLINEELAEAIASLQYYDDDFKVRRIYTAWDNRKDEAILFRGLNWLVKYGVKPDQIMVYMLCGYWPGETHADRDYRRQKLRDFGARPYPMPFRRTPELVGFQRWVVRRADLMMTWEEYAGANYRPENVTREEPVFPMFG